MAENSRYLNASHQIGEWAGYKFVFYKFTIELNYSRDQNKYSDYDSEHYYSVYVSNGPDLGAVVLPFIS